MYNCDCKKIHYTNERVGTCTGDEISLGLPAIYPGVYQLKLSFLNAEVTIEKSFEIGENLSFPTAGLNENQEWICNVIDPNGDPFKPLDELGFIIDCFAFSTTIKYTL